MKTIQPKHKKDIYEQLTHMDGAPAAVLRIRDYAESVAQMMNRAADEIKKLREENVELKKKLKSK